MKLGYVKHHNNECVINAFIDHYEYTLMKDNKRYILTREHIIMMMGKTRQNFIKEGVTIKDLEPIFKKYRRKVCLFDAFAERMLYRYDPQFPDFHAKPFGCMINIIIVMFLIMTCMHYIKHKIMKVIKNEHMHLKIFM